MRVAVFHGSPCRGNTYLAASIFMNELEKCGDVQYVEFFLPKDLPAFCTGCTLCFGGLQEKCPNAHYTAPILDAIITSDALVFATPHYGACSMPGAMKNLFDHIDFLVLNVLPRAEMFEKKAFIITTGAGSTAAVKPIKSFLNHCGVNRVYSLGLRLFANKWDKMPKVRQIRYEKAIRLAAKRFHAAKKGRPRLSTIAYYYISRFLIKRFIGEGNYPYEYWKEKGYFKKRPF